MLDALQIKNAIISVSDKTGIIELARFLDSKDINIYSTGGTYDVLIKEGIPVKSVENITNFPEMMDGRVKTLNPYIHGGILALRDNQDHLDQANKHNISFIDLLVVNLYPFEKTISRKDVSLEEAIENIDIGGPTMLRSGAKNYKFVSVLTDPDDYKNFMDEYSLHLGTTLSFREKLALKVFKKTACYDQTISSFISDRFINENLKYYKLEKGRRLRYGENSHQDAKIFLEDNNQCQNLLASAALLNGKEMSYNNYLDAQAAIDTIIQIDQPAAVVIKHNNPCGVATGVSVREAIEGAWYSDPISAMGSVIAFNRTVDMNTLRFFRGKTVKHYSFQVNEEKLIAIPTKRKFIEVIIAPDFTEEALSYLKTKKSCANIRVMAVDLNSTLENKRDLIVKIDGGYLVQNYDKDLISQIECVTVKSFNEDKMELADFAMKCCKATKSNAIIIARKLVSGGFQLLGMGAGQPNRVDSLRKLAITKAKENLEYEYRNSSISCSFEEYFTSVMEEETVLASDAFFPFGDTVEIAASYGIRHIIQPGGSMNDQDSIDICNNNGIAMLFTGRRHFKH